MAAKECVLYIHNNNNTLFMHLHSSGGWFGLTIFGTRYTHWIEYYLCNPPPVSSIGITFVLVVVIFHFTPPALIFIII